MEKFLVNGLTRINQTVESSFVFVFRMDGEWIITAATDTGDTVVTIRSDEVVCDDFDVLVLNNQKAVASAIAGCKTPKITVLETTDTKRGKKAVISFTINDDNKSMTFHSTSPDRYSVPSPKLVNVESDNTIAIDSSQIKPLIKDIGLVMKHITTPERKNVVMVDVADGQMVFWGEDLSGVGGKVSIPYEVVSGEVPDGMSFALSKKSLLAALKSAKPLDGLVLFDLVSHGMVYREDGENYMMDMMMFSYKKG